MDGLSTLSPEVELFSWTMSDIFWVWIPQPKPTYKLSLSTYHSRNSLPSFSRRRSQPDGGWSQECILGMSDVILLQSRSSTVVRPDLRKHWLMDRLGTGRLTLLQDIDNCPTGSDWGNPLDDRVAICKLLRNSDRWNSHLSVIKSINPL